MKAASTLPYPDIRVAGKNPEYARAILSNIGGDDSEMSAVSLYFYDHVMTLELPDVSQAFHSISIVEMRHLEIFCKIALQLGADPRLWERRGQKKAY